MHFHAIIVAALSAGALSIALTAKEALNSAGQPNVHCKGEDAGESAFEVGCFLVFTKLWAARHVSH